MNLPPRHPMGLRRGCGDDRSAGSLLGIPVGGLIAFIIGIGLTGGFVGALKLTETDAFLYSVTKCSSRFRSLHVACTIPSLWIQPSCGNCHVPPSFCLDCGATFGLRTRSGPPAGELNTPAKYEAHRLELAQKIWAEFKSNDSASVAVATR